MNDERMAWQAMSLRERSARLAPLLASFGVAFGAAVVSRDELAHPLLMMLAAVVTLAVAGSMLASVWARWNPIVTLVPVVLVCVTVHLMRAATGLGNTSGYGSLLLIPVVWQAMRRRQLELWLTVLAVSITNVASVFWLPSPASASAQWRSVVLFTMIAATIGQTIQHLVADRQTLLEQVAELATRDAVTGLPNRRTWDERLPIAVAGAARSGAPLALAIIDLDRFKAYNDTRGHLAGDELLRTAGQTWASMLRPSDLLVRWGGEEFALLLPDTDSLGAGDVLRRMLDATPLGQTFSAGFTVQRFHPHIRADLDHVMKIADDAMYEAKHTGRARVVEGRGPAPAGQLQPSTGRR